MSDIKKHSWWAVSRSRARLTAVGVIALTAALIGVSCVVWSSPAAQQLYHASINTGAKVLQSVEPASAQETALKAQIAKLQKQIWSTQGKLKSMQAASLSHQAISATEMATLQQELTASKKALAAAQSSVGKTTVVAGKSTPNTPAAAPIVAPTKAELLDPAQRYYGMYTQQAPFNYATFDATSAEVGVQPNMVGYFQGWDSNFRADAVQDAWARGELPLLTWESEPSDATNSEVTQPAYSLPTILSGSFDPYIEQYAKDIAATGLPLVLRFDHEMNATWYPWDEDDGHGNAINGNDPGDYVKVWQHVWNIFQAEGANQYVIWDWSPNIVNNLTASHKTLAYTQSLYPGDSYVDWVGLSGYLRPPFTTNQTISFDATFTPSLNILRSLTSRKIILSEIGASETGGFKPTWITSLFASLAEPQNSDILGFSWFDLAVSTYVQGQLATNDWRIDSRPESLAAFIAGLTNPADNFTLTPPK